MQSDITPWWQRRSYALMLILLAGLPFWWPDVPPLVDLLGHMGRYRIQLDIGSNPFFQQYYDFHWALIANLGVDLLVELGAPLFGLEPMVKAIIIAIPMIMVAGLLLIAREAHGRLPAAAAFALPLSIGYPLHFGFVNFALSTSLALLAFGLWLRLGRLGHVKLRAALFVPIGIILWVAHIYGWGLLGLLVFAHEWHADEGHWAGWRRIKAAATNCLPLAPPFVLMMIWRGDGAAGGTADWFNFSAKLAWLSAALRDRYMWFDIGCVILLVTLIYAAGRRHVLRMQPMLGLATLMLIAAYLCIPRILLGSAYADMRLVPIMLAIGVISVDARHLSPRAQKAMALLALGFFLARTGLTTNHFIDLDRRYDRQLAALTHLPRDKRVFAQISLPCQAQWASGRMDHLSSLATVRRGAFVNDQWEMAGAQLLRVHYPAGGKWVADPTQIARPTRCPHPGGNTYEQAMAQFPRAAYDYLWLIDFPPERLPVDDKSLTLVWQGKTSGALYRIGSATQASDTPTGKDPIDNQ